MVMSIPLMRTTLPWSLPALLVASYLTSGCVSNGHAPRADNPGQETSEWMRSHFLEGRAVRDALVRGELDDARSRLTQLATEAGPVDAPPSWEPRLEALRVAAREASEARDLPQATRAFAVAATRCADCHAATDARIEFERLAVPEGEAPPVQMERHQWAAERMWEGLIAPDPARFREGARVLAEAPLHPLELRAGTAPPLEVVRAAERTRSLAGQAASDEPQADRAALYGELLSTCAGCHGQLGAREPRASVEPRR
jgi:cytochrome c553